MSANTHPPNANARTKFCEARRFFRSGTQPTSSMVIFYIDRYRNRFGVKNVCTALNQNLAGDGFSGKIMGWGVLFTMHTCGMPLMGVWAKEFLDEWEAELTKVPGRVPGSKYPKIKKEG